MDTFLKSSFGFFLTLLFARDFTAPGFQSFMLLAYGWAISRERHTIANYIWLSGGVKYKHFSRFYEFLGKTFLKTQEKLWRSILLRLDEILPQDCVLELLVDDTTKKKSGKKIQGASNYKNGAGTARQEYRVLWGLNFVYVAAKLSFRKWGVIFKLVIPLGLRIYLKKEIALQLGRDYYSRSQLARQIIDFIAKFLAHRSFRVKADGGYSTKEFLRGLPENIHIVGRFTIKSHLHGPPPKRKKKRGRGRPSTKGKDLGTPKQWVKNEKGWKAHPEEKDTVIKSFTGYWHSVMPGVLITVVVVWRKHCKNDSRQNEIEAFFTTDLSLTEEQILGGYSERWFVEIDIRDAYQYYGFGKDQCRKFDNIYGANSFRLLMAASRTLWFIHYFNCEVLHLKNLRPWYRQKTQTSQLDVLSAFQEALQVEGIYPTPRFIVGVNKIKRAFLKPMKIGA